MVLKIFGVSSSTCTRRVAVVCKELNIPYEIITINFQQGEHKSPAYLTKQPFGQVPVIDDDGFQLFESRAIGRYLATKAKSPLIPQGLQANAKFEQAASVEQSNFDDFAAKLVAEKYFKPVFFGAPTDEKVAKELADKLTAKLEGYEAILSKQKYLAGNEITLADLFHLPYGYLLENQLKYDFFKTRPNVQRWWNDVSSRPSWQSVKDGA